MPRELSPAEKLVEAAAPRSMMAGLPMLDGDDGEAIRPWEPKGEKDLEAPPKVTVEGVGLVGSPPPPVTAGGSPPGTKKPVGQFGKDA